MKNSDRYTRLSKTNDWELVYDDRQDIRDCAVLDATGHRIGRVDDLVVDTEREVVSEIILEDGTRYPAEALRIDGDKVYVSTFVATGREESSRIADDYDTFEPYRTRRLAGADATATSGYRGHYEATYGESGIEYERYQPAYDFGAEIGRDQKYAGRGYKDVEHEIRSLYETRFADESATQPYTDVDQAIRYGYESINRTGRRSRQVGADLTNVKV